MIVHRISQSKYISDLEGTGAKLWGGRWNRKGVPLLYTSQALSLCLLEMLVHFNSKAAFKKDYSYISLEVPDNQIINLDQKIDINSDNDINNSRLHSIADLYFENQEALALCVPSFVLPQESNILINPEHKSFSEIKIIEVERIDIDKRLSL